MQRLRIVAPHCSAATYVHYKLHQLLRTYIHQYLVYLQTSYYKGCCASLLLVKTCSGQNLASPTAFAMAIRVVVIEKPNQMTL